MSDQGNMVQQYQELLQENKRLRNEIARLNGYLTVERVDAHRWRLYRKAERKRLAERANRPWWIRMLDADDDHVSVINMLVGALCFCGLITFMLGMVR